MSNYLKLILKQIPKDPLDFFESDFNNIRIPQNKIKNFQKLFSLNKQQGLPISYAFIAAFPYLIKVFADKRFALSPIGLIHLSSEFVEYQQLDYAAPFDIKILIKQNSSDDRGKLINIETNIYQNGILSVSNNNTMLKRLKQKFGKRSSQSKRVNSFSGELLGVITRGEILRYSKVSADFNPIHVSSLMAKLLGFPKAIAHGMYLLNLAITKSGIQPNYLLVEFKKPCFINTTTEINRENDKVIIFSDEDKLHLDIAFREL